MKRTLIYSMRAKQKGRAWPCSATAGNVQVWQLRIFSALLRMSTNDTRVSQVLILELEINFSK